MQYSQAYYKALLSGFIRNDISPEKVRELYAFIKEFPSEYETLMNDEDIINLTEDVAAVLDQDLSTEKDQRIRQRLDEYVHNAERNISTNTDGTRYETKTFSFLSVVRKYWQAAAVLIVVIGIGAYIATRNHQQPTVVAQSNIMADVAAPQTNRASITLANGQTVALDSLSNNNALVQGNAQVTKLSDGRLIYSTAGHVETKTIIYNTLNNPRGSKVVDMQLSDGSHVWLNAGSSVTYPTVFAGNERKVSLNGEGYFEVAHDPTKPFYVTKGNVTVKVLGTHFNVKAYDEDKDMHITLLQGSVSVSAYNHSVLIRPGQQAVNEGTNIFTEAADVDAAVAWKNGSFNFNKLSLQDVMRELSRWYDIDVSYQGNIPNKRFGGEIQRDLNLSDVLSGLKDIGIHYTIQGKKLIIQE